jgi:hypothetical protein
MKNKTKPTTFTEIFKNNKMTKTRSTTTKQNNKPITKSQEIKTIPISKHLIKLITFLHEANKIEFDLTKELLNRMENDNSTNE